jgi:hypothetical protein
MALPPQTIFKSITNNPRQTLAQRNEDNQNEAEGLSRMSLNPGMRINRAIAAKVAPSFAGDPQAPSPLATWRTTPGNNNLLPTQNITLTDLDSMLQRIGGTANFLRFPRQIIDMYLQMICDYVNRRPPHRPRRSVPQRPTYPVKTLKWSRNPVSVAFDS